MSTEDQIPDIPEVIHNNAYVEHSLSDAVITSSVVHSPESPMTLTESPEFNVPIPDEPPPPYTECESPLNMSSNNTDDTVSPDDVLDAVAVEDADNVDYLLMNENEAEGADTLLEFPVQTLYKLDEMINRPRWVIPVLPGGELEVLINSSIRLAKSGQDENSGECLRFYKEGLAQSATKILNDEAVQNWKADIQRAIRDNCEKLIELIVLKLNSDNLDLLEILALVVNQNSRFHQFNSHRTSEQESSLEQLEEERSTDSDSIPVPEAPKYATSLDNRVPKGWLVDLINSFGRREGFDIVLARLQKKDTLSLSVLAALLKPFSGCLEVVTPECMTTYFVPILVIARDFLVNLSDADLKKESKASSESKNDSISVILSAMKKIVRQLTVIARSEPNAEWISSVNGVDVTALRLEMILRLLRVSSFNGKMNALIEINKMLQSASSANFESSTYYSASLDSIPAAKLAAWLSENDVLTIVLRDNLHQPQYVDKLEKIIRFSIKEKTLTFKDLDSTWNAQVGKHEAIVKNVHELLTKLAWDFSADQLDYLFGKFKESWHNANSRKQREKFLALIRKLAEDDKEGEMAQKVLSLLWTLAKGEENCAAEIVDLALSAHIKILDCSVSQNREQQKVIWIETFIEQLKRPNHDDWVILSLSMIRLICRQFPENTNSASQQNFSQPRMLNILYRDKIIHTMQEKHALVTLVANSLTEYMQKMKVLASAAEACDARERREGARYTHLEQVEERLNFLCFVLKDGQLWLCLTQAVDIWNCLAENSIYQEDRQCCFRWFSKLIAEDEPDLDPDICEKFFIDQVMSLDTSLLCEEGVLCFENFFKFVNHRANKLKRTNRNKHGFVLLNENLIGCDYLWSIIRNCNDLLASKATQILIDTFTSLSVQLKAQSVRLHHEFINHCMKSFKDSYTDTLNSSFDKQKSLVRMRRNITVLMDFISRTDAQFQLERKCVALNRASFGKYLVLMVRIMNSNKQIDDFSITTHTNATIASLRKLILQKFNYTPLTAICEIGFNNAVIEPFLDYTTLESYNLTHRSLVFAKVMSCAPNVALCSSSASNATTMALSSDEEEDVVAPEGYGTQRQGALHVGGVDQSSQSGAVTDGESLLPSTIFCQQNEQLQMLLLVADWCCKQDSSPDQGDDSGGYDVVAAAARLSVLGVIRNLISILPCDPHIVDRIREVCMDHALSSAQQQSLMPSVQSLFSSPSPNQVLYYLEVLHTLLLPAVDPLGQEASQFRNHFVAADGVEIILNMVTDETSPSTSFPLQRSLKSVIVKICKLLYTLIGFSVLKIAHTFSNTFSVSAGQLASFESEMDVSLYDMEAALCSIPASLDETVLRQVATQMVSGLIHKYPSVSQLKGLLPSQSHIVALYHLATSTCNESDTACDECLKDSTNESSDLTCHRENQVVSLSSDALQCMTICFALNSKLLETLTLKPHQWQYLMQQILLKSCERKLRVNCSQQLLSLATRANVRSSCHIVNFFVSLLFDQIPNACQENAERSDAFFALICKLLEFARCLDIQIPKLSEYLRAELEFINNVKRDCNLHAAGLDGVGSRPSDFYLSGRLNLCREVVSFNFSLDEKSQLDNDLSRCLSQLIQDLFSHFLFPATAQLLEQSATPGTTDPFTLASKTEPICDQSMTQNAAFQLLVALSATNFNSFRLVTSLLKKYFYMRNVTTISEWEFQPPIGCKQVGGFVGLKNAGATCYMNSVIQQLFMVPEVRQGILAIEKVADDYFESEQTAAASCGLASELCKLSKCTSPTSLEHGVEDSGIDSTSDVVSLTSNLSSQLVLAAPTAAEVATNSRIQYHMDVLKYLQVIFGYLAASQLQFYTPEGFWKHFRFAGEPVNLREQQDALEFLNSIVDSVDEATKLLNNTGSNTISSVFSTVIGGSFADQKICKDCPHRYSREEPFTTLSVDIRNNQTLKDSFEQYVKGDLLEGENAYFCEKCGKKVDTVKRMCIKKAPPVLIIQLKRFDYDWERDCAIKFNDYFEFPFQLDIEPYTVDGLAKIEGEIIRDDSFDNPPDFSSPDTGVDSTTPTPNSSSAVGKGADESVSGGCIYKLMGVVVHSGQASGGHYNSYIQCRQRDPLANRSHSSSSNSTAGKWFKFDDGDVSELQVDFDDEHTVSELLKNQWFGGDNTASGSGSGGVGGAANVSSDINSSTPATSSSSFAFEHNTSFNNRRASSTGRRQKRWWNAYLLVYEKQSLSEQQEPVSLKELSADSSVSQVANATAPSEVPVLDEGYPTSVSTTSSETIASSQSLSKTVAADPLLQLMPKSIARAVQLQTIIFAHNRVQFMPEYLNFIKSLVSHCQQSYMMDLRELSTCTTPKTVAEEFGLLSMQLLCNVVFNTAFHTKKCLRGSAAEWVDLMITLLKHVACTRLWLAENWILKYKQLIPHYILDCPSAEVRQSFVRLLVYLCHFSNFGELHYVQTIADHTRPLNAVTKSQSVRVSDVIIYEMTQLMRKDVRESVSTSSVVTSPSGKHLNHYFHFYLHYASFGAKERAQLLQGGGEVALAMINLMLEEACSSSSSNSHVKYQISEFAKLYQVVSNLVRGCDLSIYCASSAGKEVSREVYMIGNVYRDKEMTVSVPVSVALKERLLDETVYAKRIIEECPNSEETITLICFLSWENASFSAAVLSDILWQITFAYSTELKPYLDLLLEVLKIPDSWQQQRIMKSLKGGTPKKQESKDGLFETIDKSKTHFARRAYLSIKMLTTLFASSPSALEVLRRDCEIRAQWLKVVDWLKNELNRNQFPSKSGLNQQNSQFSQYSWSDNSSSCSNETANGYALERSPSARFTLQRASELIPRSVPVVSASGGSPVQKHSNVNSSSTESEEVVSSQPPSTSPVSDIGEVDEGEGDEESRESVVVASEDVESVIGDQSKLKVTSDSGDRERTLDPPRNYQNKDKLDSSTPIISTNTNPHINQDNIGRTSDA